MSTIRNAGVLGRVAYSQHDSDRLLSNLERLDALLCLVSNQDVDRENNANDFQMLNPEIQRSVLNLASDLAWEAHDLWATLQASKIETMITTARA